MTTNGWRTMTVEQAEYVLDRQMYSLSCIQCAMDGYDRDGIPIPTDLLSMYQDNIDRLSAFADAWGFDIGDVAISASRDTML